MGEIILKMQGIQKYFPGVHALDDAQLEVRAGEVMALVGENGAGKSTLMKILTGIYSKDGGTMEFMGEQVELTGPKDVERIYPAVQGYRNDKIAFFLHKPRNAEALAAEHQCAAAVKIGF